LVLACRLYSMGVVRREGNWRLNKLEDGLYEISHNKEPQERIVTPKYVDNTFGGIQSLGLPVHRVDSYSEAEGLFEERAHSASPGPTSLGPSMGVSGQTDDPISRDLESLEDIDDLPPGGVAIVMITGGAIFLWTMGLEFGSPAFLIGSGLLLAGISILAWALVVSDDIASALSLLTTGENSDSKPDENESTDKTPPTPEKLKHDLFFDRANQHCEWCGTQIDQPEVHHIVPRSEGGPNDPSNLIVLCPNDHRKADRGAISRTKLKAKLRRLEE